MRINPITEFRSNFFSSILSILDLTKFRICQVFFNTRFCIQKINQSQFYAIVALFLSILANSAAFTKATNKGCGLATVLLYSGWY